MTNPRLHHYVHDRLEGKVMGGWLLFPSLLRLGAEAARALRQRVASELKTTFASSYAKEISLTEAPQPAEISVYGQRATGTKYLINPSKGLMS